MLQSISKVLKKWWNYQSMTEYERYLSHSIDMEDFERRQKNYFRSNNYPLGFYDDYYRRMF